MRMKADQVLKAASIADFERRWNISAGTPTSVKGLTFTREKWTVFANIDNIGRLTAGFVYANYDPCGPNKAVIALGVDDKNKLQILKAFLEEEVK